MGYNLTCLHMVDVRPAACALPSGLGPFATTRTPLARFSPNSLRNAADGALRAVLGLAGASLDRWRRQRLGPGSGRDPLRQRACRGRAGGPAEMDVFRRRRRDRGRRSGLCRDDGRRRVQR